MHVWLDNAQRNVTVECFVHHVPCNTTTVQRTHYRGAWLPPLVETRTISICKLRGAEAAPTIISRLHFRKVSTWAGIKGCACIYRLIKCRLHGLCFYHEQCV